MDFFLNRTADSGYLRIVSLGWAVPFKTARGLAVELGRGTVLCDGSQGVVFGYGPWLLANAWEAIGRLPTGGVGLTLVNLPWLNRLDTAWLSATIGHARHVITLDNHYVHGGQGDMIAAAVAGLGLAAVPRVSKLGVTELPACGTNEEVLRYHRLDVEGLYASMRAVITGTA